MTTSEGFGEWIPLTAAGLLLATEGAGAVQLCRADKSLIEYPKGKSTMVFYFYAGRSVRDALRKVFADEIDEAGARGEGPLSFRFLAGGDEAKRWLEGLYEEFCDRFGAPPILHVVDDDEDD